MKRFYKIFLLALFAIYCGTIQAQQGLGTSSPNSSAVLDLVSGNKGALLPRVALTGSDDTNTIKVAATSLIVFNTATVSDVVPGYYYWTGSKWNRLITMNDITTWSLAGDVTGTLGATTVAKIQGKAISTTAPTSDQVLSYNSTTSTWTPNTPPISVVNTSNLFSSSIGGGSGVTSTSAANFFGSFAGQGATSASGSNFFGSYTGRNASGASYSNFLGTNAGYGATSASSSNFLGQTAGYGAVNATFSNFIGQNAGFSAKNASYSTLIGFNAGSDNGLGTNIGTNNIVIGTNITLPATRANAINLGGVLFGTGSYGTTSGNPSEAAVATGKIGIGMVTPTARLHLPAGTATAGYAPLKLTAGTNLTATEAGAVEYDGSHLYFTAADAGTRYQLDQQASSATSANTPNTIVARDGSGNFSAGTITAVNDLVSTAGNLTTTATTANVFNTNATTLNVGGAATALNLGATTGTTTVNNNLIVKGSTTLGTTTASDLAASYTLPVATIDGYSALVVTQTTAASTITLPTPTITTAGRVFTISNAGSSTKDLTVKFGSPSFLYSVIPAGTSTKFVYDGSNWSTPSLPIRLGANNSLFSYNSGSSSTVANSNFLGNQAGLNAPNASSSNFLGNGAGFAATSASNSNFLGYVAGSNATNAANSNFFGYQTGRLAINAAYSTLIGYNVENENTMGTNIGSNNIIIGTSIGLPAATANAINLGGVLFGTGAYYSTSTISTAAVATGKIGIGVVTPTARLHLPAGTASAGYAPLKLTAGTNLTATEAGAVEYDGSHLYFTATDAGTRYQLDQQPSAISVVNNNNLYSTSIGAGNSTTSTYSIFFGYSSGAGASSVSSSNFIGNSAGYQSQSAPNSNYIGSSTGFGSNGSSYSNFVGYAAGAQTVNASYSTLIGYQVGYETSSSHIGSNNVIIGTNITLPNATTNAINLGGVLFGTGSYGTTTGDASATATTTGKIGIGLVTPTARLQLPAGTASAGYAPLKLTAGTNLTATEAGAVEYDGSHLYFTATDAGTRYQLDQQASSATSANIANTIVARDASGNFSAGTITAVNNLVSTAGNLTTTATTAKVFNTNATTLNVGGAATALNLGATTGTTTVNNNLIVKGSTTLGTTTASNFVASYTLPVATIDGYSALVVTQTTAASTITLPTPTNTTAGRVFTISNAESSTQNLTVNSIFVPVGTSSTFVYNGSSWSSPSNPISVVNTSNLFSSSLSGGNGVTTISNSNFLGANAGGSATNASNSNFLGVNAGANATNAGNSNFLGANAGNGATNAGCSNFLGTNAGNGATNVGCSNFLGINAGNNATAASYSNFIGNNAGYSAKNASYSTLIGYNVGYENSTSHMGSNNVIIGTNITLPDATTNAINLGGVLFCTGSYGTTGGSPSAAATTTGKVGIGVVTPTARLHLPAGTASAGYAPLKLTAGTNLSTTEAGAVEYNGSHLYFTAADAGTRYQLDQQFTGTVTGDLSATRYLATMPSAITAAATTTVDLSTGNVFTLNVGANVTTLTLNNAPTKPATFMFKLTYSSGTAYSITWPATFLWSGGTPPTLTCISGKTDIVSIFFDGTTYYCTSALNF